VSGPEVSRLPRRRWLDDETHRYWLTTTVVVAVALLAAVALILAVGLRMASRNAEKGERQSVACIQQGGAWLDSYGDCVYSRRAP
jgi:hypothetical protein